MRRLSCLNPHDTHHHACTLRKNHVMQDSKGDFTRTWVPELAKLPTKHLLAPWDAPQQVLDAAGVELGVTYPNRIIDTDMRVR